jgi:hypothetical protein
MALGTNRLIVIICIHISIFFSKKHYTNGTKLGGIITQMAHQIARANYAIDWLKFKMSSQNPHV